MKFNDIVKVRKKYTNYIFDLCFKSFKTPRTFSEEELRLKKNMDYDWLLQSQSTRIAKQTNMLNQRIREFSKLAQFDKRAMNELMELKLTLKKQKKSIEGLQLKHYNEIEREYSEILISLANKLLLEMNQDSTFAKMLLIIQKSEKKFIDFCEQWKSDKIKYYENISSQSKLIMQTCQEIIQDIDNSILAESNSDYIYDDKSVKIVSMKNLKIVNNCTNLSYYVENFKQFYPETLNYNTNSLIKLELKENFKEFSHLGAIGSAQNTVNMKSKFLLAKEHIRKTQEIFYGINDISRQYHIKLEHERKKIVKVAIPEDKLTKITIKQWLEYDPDGIFYLFSEYLKEHEFS